MNAIIQNSTDEKIVEQLSMDDIFQNSTDEDKAKEIESILNTITPENGGEDEIMKAAAALLSLPDDQFALIAPTVMDTYEREMNLPDVKLALVQSLNANGSTVEDLQEEFEKLLTAIDESDFSEIKRDFIKEIFSTILNSVSETEGIAKKFITVPIKLTSEAAKIPEYAHISDSGVDVYALEDITIHPGETKLVSTGIQVALPVGYELQVRPKSGRALKTKLRVANTPGTIDQGYRDEIKIIVENIEAPIQDITLDSEGRVTSILYGKDYFIGKGEKFCQLVLSDVPKINFVQVENLVDDGADRGGGFGSTSLYSKDDPRAENTPSQEG